MIMNHDAIDNVTQAIYRNRRGSSLIAPSLLLAVRVLVLEHDFSDERLMEILKTLIKAMLPQCRTKDQLEYM